MDQRGRIEMIPDTEAASPEEALGKLMSRFPDSHVRVESFTVPTYAHAGDMLPAQRQEALQAQWDAEMLPIQRLAQIGPLLREIHGDKKLLADLHLAARNFKPERGLSFGATARLKVQAAEEARQRATALRAPTSPAPTPPNTPADLSVGLNGEFRLWSPGPLRRSRSIARQRDGIIVVEDPVEILRVEEAANGDPVYLQNKEVLDAEAQDSEMARRSQEQLEQFRRAAGGRQTSPDLIHAEEIRLAKLHGTHANAARKAGIDLQQKRLDRQRYFRDQAEALRQQVESHHVSIEARRREILASAQDKGEMSYALLMLSNDAARGADELRSRNHALFQEAEQDFENGILSTHEYRAFGRRHGIPDLVQSYQQKVEREQRISSLSNIAEEAMLGSNEAFRRGEGAHVQITRDYREEFTAAIKKPASIVLHLASGRTQEIAVEGETDETIIQRAEEVRRYAHDYGGDPVLGYEVHTPGMRLAALQRKYAHELESSHARVRAALKAHGVEDDATIAEVEARALVTAASKLPRGAGEKARDPEYWAKNLPVAGGFIEILGTRAIGNIAQRVAAGDPNVTQGELAVLRDFLIELERPDTWAAKVLDFTVTSLSLGAEFAITRRVGAGKLGHDLALKAVEEATALGIRRLATKEGRDLVKKHLLTRMTGAAGHITAHTLTGNLSRVMSRAYHDSALSGGLDVMVTPEGRYYAQVLASHERGSFMEKLPGAFLHQLVENTSERLGAHLKLPDRARDALRSMSQPAREAVTRQAIFRAFAQKLGGQRASQVLSRANERLAALQIHGTPQEIAEEYIAALGHTVLEGEELNLPTAHDITAMLASMVVLRGSAAAPGSGSATSSTLSQSTTPGASGDSQFDLVGFQEGGEALASMPPTQLPAEKASLADALASIATTDAFRRGPASTSKDLSEIVQQYSLSPEDAQLYELDAPLGFSDKSFQFRHSRGGVGYVLVEGNNVWVSSPDMRAQGKGMSEDQEAVQGGDLLYQAAMTYAHNNSLKFIPDDAVSPIAKVRRTSQMLSSALRHRTTRHLSPYGRSPSANDSVAGAWRDDDSPQAYTHNLELLAQQELQNVSDVLNQHGLDLENLRYHPETDTVEQRTANSDGTLSIWKRLSEGDFTDLVAGLDPGNSGVGPTTLSRSLVIKSALEGHDIVPRAAEHYQPEETLRGGASAPGQRAKLLRILGSREARHKIFYSLSDPTATERVQHTGVTAADTQHVESAFRRTPQGQAAWGNVLILNNRASLDGQQGRAGELGYHPEDWQLMETAEGFHDPRSGQAVIFRDNIRVLEGETPALAVARVVLHERVGHHGFDVLRDSDATFAKSWAQLASQIPQTELDTLTGSYPHLAGNREGLALEWFAHRAGQLESVRHLQPGSALERMWQAVRDFLQRYYDHFSRSSHTPMSQEVLDAHVRHFVSRVRSGLSAAPTNSHQLPSHGMGGTESVVPIHSEPPAKPAFQSGPTLLSPSHVDVPFAIPYSNRHDQSSDLRRDAQAALRTLLARAEHDAERNARSNAEERIRSEAESLVSWAESGGWLVEADGFSTLSQGFADLEGGAEHDVFAAPVYGRVIKLTRAPNFGARGRLVDYLWNIKWSNDLFHDDIKLEGVIPSDAGPLLVTSQPFIQGTSPKEEMIAEWFGLQGYVKAGPGTWKNPESGALVADANPRNFVLTPEGDIVR